jgi:hypothetical protein
VVGLLGAKIESVFQEGDEMKIDKCGKYLLRNGNKAEVVSLNGDGIQSVVGYMILSDGKTIASQWSDSGRFFTGGREAASDIVAEWIEPKPPQYVPYTWEDRDELRGRWFRLKNTEGTDANEYMAIQMTNDSEILTVNSMTAEYFLAEYEWLDGTPCGKVVTE